MSLVNDMLKDLDARKAQGTAEDASDDVTSGLEPVSRRKPLLRGLNVPKRTLVMVGLAMALGIGLAVDYMIPKKKTPPVPQVMSMESDAANPAVIAEAESAGAANTEVTDTTVTDSVPTDVSASSVGSVDGREPQESLASPDTSEAAAPVAPTVAAEPVATPTAAPEPALSQAPPASPEVAVESIKPAPENGKGKVKSINVLQEENRTIVRFVMERFATYTLTNNTPGRLRVWFRDTALPSETPRISASPQLRNIARGATEKSDFYDVEFAEGVDVSTEYVADASGESAGEIRVKLKSKPGAAGDKIAKAEDASATKIAAQSGDTPLPETKVESLVEPPSTDSATVSALSLDTPVPADVDTAIDHGERADNLWQAGVNRLRRGDTTGGKAALRAALRAEPRHIDARVALVNQLIKERRLEEARESLDEGLAVDASEPELAIRWARLAVDKGDTEAAVRVLEEASGRAQDNWEYQTFLAALYQRSGLLTKSASIYEAAVAQYPQRGDWWFGLGLAQDSQGKAQSALVAYKKALRDKKLAPALREFANQRLSNDR
jgi:Tfp pilus assembly protein PilF